MPANKDGVHLDARPYQASDGFSPGQTILVRVPGLDNPEALRRTAAAPINHIGRYRRRNAPVVVIDARTGRRWPIWVEIDSNADSPAETLLEIHPAKNFDARHRYIVALRNLKNRRGREITAPAGFRFYRDRLPSRKRVINKRRGDFENIFGKLRRAGIDRDELYLAWDFTVASDENNARRLLFMRNQVFAALGDTDLDDGVPTGGTVPFAIDPVSADPATSGIVNFAPCGADGCQAGENADLARRVRGTFTVPCYLTNACAPPARFILGADGNPTLQGSYAANFDCVIPRTAPDAATVPAGRRPLLFGHGLLGRATEAIDDPQGTLARAHGFVICATDQIGLTANDIPNTIGILGDLGRFPELTDTVQQGLLNELLLGRLMIRPSGFASSAAFQVDPSDGGSPSTIDPSNLYYKGTSLGGIAGGALTAIAPDFTRAVLDVPAMNFSVLLPRSVDFGTYALVFEPAYSDEMARPLILDLIQMLWDRSETNGYAHRMTDDPFPDTPPHEVLMHIAFGDHQVTPWQADVEARTIGASAHAPVVYDGRWPGVDPLWGIPRITSYPFADSAIVYWDSGPTRPNPAPPPAQIGTDPPPLTNLPNRSGRNPHQDPRRDPAEQQMTSDFLRPNPQSQITDACLGLPCFSGTFTGP